MFQRTINFLILAAIMGLVGLSGCSQVTDSEVSNTGNVNRSPAITGKTPEAVVMANSAAPPVNNNSGIAVNDTKPKHSVSQPTPQIGSGGDDFSMFTQIRGQLSADKELSTAVIVEVKEGVVTLNGNVSSEAQKSKAGQIVQSVKGIKSLKNNLRVV